jgi:hypothetical protein
VKAIASNSEERWRGGGTVSPCGHDQLVEFEQPQAGAE